MEEQKNNKIEIKIPTPKEILSKYLKPRDNTYFLDNIKEYENKNIELKKIMANPKKLAKYNKSKEHDWLGGAEGELSYNLRQIERFTKEINKGDYRGTGRTNVMNQLSRYEDKPCVAAGLIENLMGLFIIRGKVKSFAFVVQREDFWIGGYSYKIGYVSIEDFFKIFEEIKNNPNTAPGVANIYSQELYDQIKKEMIVYKITYNIK